MTARPAFCVTPRLVIGLVIIALGTVFFLDSLDLVEADRVLRFWPAVLIAIGAGKLIRHGTSAARAAGALWLVAGSLLLLANLDYLRLSMRRAWPLVLVVVGAWIVWRAVAGGRAGEPSRDDPGDVVNMLAFLAGVNQKPSSKSFRGGDATAVMGGCELDLRDALPAGGEAAIDVFALWGGVEIIVPGDWTVVLQATPIMGGVEDTRKSVGSDPTKRLIVTGLAIMGGVEIKN